MLKVLLHHWKVLVLHVLCITTSLAGMALPFPLEKYTPKQILKMQQSRAWKFRAKAIAKYAAASITLVQNMLEPDPRKRPTSQSLLTADWFSMADKEKTMPLLVQLTEFEKQALMAAENAKIDNVEATLNTNMFDLLEMKTEPYPSVNILKPPSPPRKRPEKRDSSPPLEVSSSAAVVRTQASSLERVTETINLKEVPSEKPAIPPAQPTTADPTPN